MDTGDDPYRILGLYKSDVTVDPSSRIKKAYRELARLYHPDKNIRNSGSSVGYGNGNGNDCDPTLMFAKITHAYEILKDDDSRRSYDLSQLHNSQKGYNPNGPTYSDDSSTTTNTTTDTGNTSHSTPTSKSKTYHEPFICRSASTTTTDTKTGKPKTFSYSTTSDGITTVDVKSPDGTNFSFSVPEHKNKEVYKLFKKQFGKNAANQFFPKNKKMIKNDADADADNDKTKRKKKKKDAKKKKKDQQQHKPILAISDDTNQYNSNIDSSTSEINDNDSGKQQHTNRQDTSFMNSPTSVATNFYTTPSSSKTTTTTTTKKKKKTIPSTVGENLISLYNDNNNSINTSITKPRMQTSIVLRNNDTSSSDNNNGYGKLDADIQSMSTKEKTVINPLTKRKEVIIETSISKFDGSSEVRTERRQL